MILRRAFLGARRLATRRSPRAYDGASRRGETLAEAGSYQAKLRSALTLPNAGSPLSHLSTHAVSATGNTARTLALRCTEVDESGQIRASSSEVNRLDLCTSHAILHRDLRKLDDKFQHQLPAILIRPAAILLNLGPLKAIVRHDRVVVVEPSDRTALAYVTSRFIFELQSSLRRSHEEPGMAFEFRALEVFLSSAIANLREEVDHTLPSMEHFLQKTLDVSQVDKSTLTTLLQSSKTISSIQARVTSIRDAINDVLESDEDLSNMYLTGKARNQPRSVNDHDEAEVLLETYLKEAEEILARVLQVDELIQSTEDIINISLDSQRNSLLLLELRLAMGTFAVANGALVSSFFGMNLLTGMENHPAAFWGVSATSVGLVAAVFVWCSRRLRQNQ